MREAETAGTASPGERLRPEPPSVYVASLSDYNAGRLHGAWLPADQDAEALHEGVRAMLAGSPEPGAEEWAIHDYQGFGAVELSEYESLETVVSLAKGIAEHGPAFGAWAALVGLDRGLALDNEAFLDAYQGHWPSVTDYAEDLLEEVGATEVLDGLPAWLQPYLRLDAKGFGRDLALGGDIRTVEGDGGLWVFGAET